MLLNVIINLLVDNDDDVDDIKEGHEMVVQKSNNNNNVNHNIYAIIIELAHNWIIFTRTKLSFEISGFILYNCM